MDPDSRLGRLAAVLSRGLGALAALGHRRFGWTLIVAAALVAAAAVSAGRLRVDPDITRLLPREVPSVRAVEALRDRFGGIGYVVVLVEGGAAPARRALADDLAPRLAALPTVRDVDARRPIEFFDERALYFLEEAELATLRDRLRARYRWEVERALVDVDDATPPPVETADLEAAARARLAGAGRGAMRGSPYYEDEAGRVLAIFVRPTELASDLGFSKRVVADVERVLAEARPAIEAASLSVSLTGRYKKRVDLQELLTRDVAFTGALSLGLIVLWVALHFRRALATVLVVAPLQAGLALSYGLAGATFGTLNVLSAFIGAILVGIGIDHGIHLLGRYEEERGRGLAPEEAVRAAFGAAGRVSLGAALTSAAAFACLAWTDFRAFREFGALAAAGLLLILASYLLLLPALLGLAGHLGWGLRPRAPRGLPGAGWLVRLAPLVTWLVLVGLLVASGHAGAVRFDTDFSRLDAADLPSFHRDREVNALLGRSQTPLVILAPSEAEARAAADVVRRSQAALGERATIGAVATAADLVPQRQSDKRVLLDEIGQLAARFRGRAVDEGTRRAIDELRRRAAAPPFGADDLPPSLRQLFATRPGAEEAHVVLLFPTVGMGDAEAIARLAGQLRDVALPGGRTLQTAGEPIVMADVLATVKADAPRIFGATTALVLLVLVVTMGRLRTALLALAPAVLTLTATFGLLPLVGVDLNYLNVVVLPILLGIGVDDGAHLVARLDAGEPLEGVWRHTGGDVTGAILTDVFGFGALALAAHPGLGSLGKVALVGLAVNWLAAVILLPAAIATFGLLPGVPARPMGGVAGAIAKGLGAGHSAVGPGTAGALVAVPIAWATATLPTSARVAVALGVAALGWWATAAYVRSRRGGPGASKDPQEVVVDETAGCLLALSVVPFELGWVALGFGLFRALDILKPGPVGWAERRLPGPAGVMADDVVAGAVAAVALLAARALSA